MPSVSELARQDEAPASKVCPCTEVWENKVKAVAAERDRLKEALTWAVGFIRCNFPKSVAPYPDYRNAVDLLAEVGQVVTGEFTLTRHRAEQAEAERDALKAAIGRLGEQCGDTVIGNGDVSCTLARWAKEVLR